MSNTKGRLAVDIGGTFTDVALDHGGELTTTKTLTTPSNPIIGVLDGIRRVLNKAQIEITQIDTIIHGTTLAANALIERKGAKVAFITTEGFRDILEIAYERRYDQYDLLIDKPELLVDRKLCWTVQERMDAQGQVVRPLNEETVDTLVNQIIDQSVESVAICLLHSYLNTSHEKQVRQLLLQKIPGLSISLSSDICPEIREYDRACTVVANAYVKPLMENYLNDLSSAIREQGFPGALLLMTSGGGMTTLETAIQAPIRLVESGPSGGAILASQIAEQCGAEKVVSFDMGGTTAKLCLIEDFKPHRSRQFEIARAARFIKGSGLPVRIPVIEMIEIGAGGGSVAGIDSLERITVGPESAGSDPGPACFDQGGEQPTVTDSDLLLGYLDPEYFAEGKLNLAPGNASHSITRAIAEPLEIEPTLAAYGISQIVDESMSNAARVHAAEWGQEIAGRTLIAFGGNGPLHATRIADKTDISRIIIPKDPGVGSAVGFLTAPVSYEIIKSLYLRLSQFDPASVAQLLSEMETEARTIVLNGAPAARLVEKRIAFMRYDGQGHEIEITLPPGPVDDQTASKLRDNFETKYKQLFGRLVPNVDIEIINWAFVASTEDRPQARSEIPEKTAMAGINGSTRIYCRKAKKQVEAQVHRRHALKTGDRVVGPAMISEPQTTTLVEQGFEALIDSALNIVMTRVETIGRSATDVN